MAGQDELSSEIRATSDTFLVNLLIFLALLIAFAGIGYYLTIELGLKRHYMAALMWSPGLAALATCKLRGINLKMIGWHWGESRWQWTAYLLPILYGAVAYGIIWGFGLGGAVNPRFIAGVGEFLGLSGWSNTSVVAFTIVMFGIVGMIWRVGAALGEEIGWRGFLTPHLMQRFSFPITSLIVGLVWAVWHAPLIYFTKYNAGPYDLNVQMVNFAVLTIGLSFIMTYLRLKSGSVWTAAILHASHNAYVLSLFGEMTIKYEETRKYAGEFGFILPAVIALVGVYFWYRAAQEGLVQSTMPAQKNDDAK